MTRKRPSGRHLKLGWQPKAKGLAKQRQTPCSSGESTKYFPFADRKVRLQQPSSYRNLAAYCRPWGSDWCMFTSSSAGFNNVTLTAVGTHGSPGPFRRNSVNTSALMTAMGCDNDESWSVSV